MEGARGTGGGAGGGEQRGQDTVCLLLQQPASLTLAAQRLLGHHEEKVRVGQSLRVEQPAGGTERRGVGARPSPPRRRPRPSPPQAPPTRLAPAGPHWVLRSGSPRAPGAVSAVDDGVVGGVHRPEVVLSLFHDAAALARLGAPLGLRGVCGAQSASAPPVHPGQLRPQPRSAVSPALSWPGCRLNLDSGGEVRGGASRALPTCLEPAVIDEAIEELLEQGPAGYE